MRVRCRHDALKYFSVYFLKMILLRHQSTRIKIRKLTMMQGCQSGLLLYSNFINSPSNVFYDKGGKKIVSSPGSNLRFTPCI